MTTDEASETLVVKLTARSVNLGTNASTIAQIDNPLARAAITCDQMPDESFVGFVIA
jgi:hypothetical protein